MITICLDFEGVLGPEIWEEVSKATNIPELMRTTREEPDFQKLMDWRIGILRNNNIDIAKLREIVVKLEPLENAIELVARLKEDFQLIVVTDCPWELVAPLIKKLGNPAAFSNQLVIDDDGYASAFHFRIVDQKATSVRALQSTGYKVIAAGDSYNDLSMLTAAEKGILFRSTKTIISDYPHFEHIEDHEVLIERIYEVAAEIDA